MDHGGEICRFWILQSACGNVCGYFVSHGVSEDASHGGISGGDVQRGRWVLSRFGVCGGSETMGDRGAAAVGELFADGVHGGERRGRGKFNSGPGPYKRAAGRVAA